MTRGVVALRTKRRGVADCEHCDKLDDRMVTRERVRQHVLRTGHVAKFVIEDITVYRRADDAVR